MKNILKITILIVTVIFMPQCKKEPTTNADAPVELENLTDIDGNSYKTVKIGSQIWMAENLKVTHYNDGEIIPYVSSGYDWPYLKTAAYCFYNNDMDYNSDYGKLYNWNAVNSGKLAPDGWHVPSDEEWSNLINYLGGEEIAANKLKETGTIHWNYTNDAITNESIFTALPGGRRITFLVNAFMEFGDIGYWWSSSSGERDGAAIYWVISEHVYKMDDHQEFGLSVRCVKD